MYRYIRYVTFFWLLAGWLGVLEESAYQKNGLNDC